jgi:alpha-N-arabinofuranosidase
VKSSTVHLHTRHRIGKVDPRLFGGFLEHMGRAVYEGVYDPSSPNADSEGWREDVLDALRGLDMTVMRYPGGNFASGYHWRDGVGPSEERPRVRELAWNSIETNQVGSDEYLSLARRMHWQPMLAVNLGTGSPEEARDWVEYCNAAPGTRYADLRVANGREKPHGVKLWCLGNEMDGPWQLGHVPAEEYARRAQQAAKMMKDVDRDLELVACGSSNTGMTSWLEWDRTVLEHVGGLADYVSLHAYVGKRTDTMDFLAVTNAIDRQIEQVDAVCRYVQGRRRSGKRAYLSFDEWNVWYKTMSGEHMDGAGQSAPALIEEVYTLEDALVVAGFLHCFLRHADVVKIANLAQIVNVIAPILTKRNEVLLQSTYWPFAMVSDKREGHSLRVVVDGPAYEGQTHGRATHVDASAVLAGERRLTLFLTNRDDSEAEVAIAVADRELGELLETRVLSGPSPEAANSWEAPDVITAQPTDALTLHAGRATLRLPPFSFTSASFHLA